MLIENDTFVRLTVMKLKYILTTLIVEYSTFRMYLIKCIIEAKILSWNDSGLTASGGCSTGMVKRPQSVVSHLTHLRSLSSSFFLLSISSFSSSSSLCFSATLSSLTLRRSSEVVKGGISSPPQCSQGRRWAATWRGYFRGGIKITG